MLPRVLPEYIVLSLADDHKQPGVLLMSETGKQSSLLRSLGTVGGMTMLSRLLGFVRDIVFAGMFGASGSLDAFFIAFKIPNFLRRMFAEGAFAQAFVPVLSGQKQQLATADVHAFINKVAGNLAAALLILVLVAEIAAPLLINVFAPGFYADPAKHALATHMLRITFPYILLIALTAMSGAVMNSYQRFAIPAFTPVLLNVAFIAAAVFAAPHVAQPVHVLAWAVVAGGVLQLAIQLPALRKIGFVPRLKVDWRDPGVRQVLRLMLPICFGASVAQLSILIDNVFASFLPAGSISWLYYADRFTYLPLGVIGVALSTVVLPNLSREHVAASAQQFQKTLAWALRLVLVVGLPSALALTFLAKPILFTCLYRGHFSITDVEKTAAALRVFALGLPAFMLIKILASAFYARKQVKTPVKVAGVALLINIGLNFLLIHRYLHVGLAASTTVAAWVNALLLIYFLRKELKTKLLVANSFLLQTLCANILLALALWLFVRHFSEWGNWTEIKRISMLIGCGIILKLAYIAVLMLLGVRWKMLRE